MWEGSPALFISLPSSFCNLVPRDTEGEPLLTTFLAATASLPRLLHQSSLPSVEAEKIRNSLPQKGTLRLGLGAGG